jgi:hypothetical protein
MSINELYEKREEAVENDNWRLVDEIDRQLAYLQCGCLTDWHGNVLIELWG